MSTIKIPSLMERLQAVVADGLIIVVLMILTTFLFDKIGEVSGTMRMYVFIFLFFVYDPLLTSMGGTLGHRAMKLRVRRESNPDKNISILSAIPRFAVKGLLGWISFLFIAANAKGKAIHDFAAGSIVVYKEDVDGTASDEAK